MPSGTRSPTVFFSKHASDYAKSASHAHGSDLAALVAALSPRPSETILDVATGTGFTAIEVSPLVNSVVATDLTTEMLAQAKRLARERGVTNIGFEEADASDLPHRDSSFDIVTTRRAPHHFRDIPLFLREARRVLRRGGRLGIADMSPPEECETFFNRIERIRDDTHVKALSPTQWLASVRRAGFTVASTEILSDKVSFEGWLYPVKMGGTEEASIRRAWAKAPPKVRRILEVRETQNVVEGWTKTRIVLVAKR